MSARAAPAAAPRQPVTPFILLGVPTGKPSVGLTVLALRAPAPAWGRLRAKRRAGTGRTDAPLTFLPLRRTTPLP